MNLEKFAQSIDGRMRREEVTPDEIAYAESQDWLIAYGYSDDLVVLHGFVDDEVGAYEGTQIEISKDGLREQWPEGEEKGIEEARKYFERSEKFVTINAVWSDTESPCWVLLLDGLGVDYHGFVILGEGNEPFCSGLVIDCSTLN